VDVGEDGGCGDAGDAGEGGDGAEERGAGVIDGVGEYSEDEV
jgi:hypothetical protein